MEENTNNSGNNNDQRGTTLDGKHQEHQGARPRDPKTKEGLSDSKKQKKIVVKVEIQNSSTVKGPSINFEDKSKLQRSVWNNKDYCNSDSANYTSRVPPSNILYSASQPISFLGPLEFARCRNFDQNKPTIIGGTLKKSIPQQNTERFSDNYKTSGESDMVKLSASTKTKLSLAENRDWSPTVGQSSPEQFKGSTRPFGNSNNHASSGPNLSAVSSSKLDKIPEHDGNNTTVDRSFAEQHMQPRKNCNHVTFELPGTSKQCNMLMTSPSNLTKPTHTGHIDQNYIGVHKCFPKHLMLPMAAVSNKHATSELAGTPKKSILVVRSPTNSAKPIPTGNVYRNNSTVNRSPSETFMEPTQDIAQSNNEESLEFEETSAESDFVMVSVSNHPLQADGRHSLEEEQLKLLADALIDPTDPNTHNQ